MLLCVALAAGDKLRLSTIVIDAGHGGKDPGAVSQDKKTYEKTLTLDIAKTLADKIRAAYAEHFSELAAMLRELSRRLDLGWDAACEALPFKAPRLPTLLKSPDLELSERLKIRREAAL